MAQMKIFILYDEKGEIKATAVPAHEEARVRSSDGTQVHVIDHPGLDRKEMSRYLIDLHQKHRVEVVGGPRLLRKRVV